MLQNLFGLGVQYSVYVLELALLIYLVFSQQWKRLSGVCAYVCLFFLLDGVGRPYVLYHYGLSSREYGYFYWLTDVVLALGAFLLVCAFFRRACAHEKKLWNFISLLLIFVFILVPGVSLISLTRNYDHLFSGFIYEFTQNLFFTCLVLNTLLYLLMQQIQSADDELGLLVCGIGIQFAGPAASLALLHLTAAQSYARSLNSLVGPLCTVGMLLAWSYAVTRRPALAAQGGRAVAPDLAAEGALAESR